MINPIDTAMLEDIFRIQYKCSCCGKTGAFVQLVRNLGKGFGLNKKAEEKGYLLVSCDHCKKTEFFSLEYFNGVIEKTVDNDPKGASLCDICSSQLF